MQERKAFSPKHPFLVCIDSDGCAFDVMEIKHKECFCPAFIEDFSMQPVSKYARDAWDFVNLYSSTRGIHRLLALLRVMDLLSERYEVAQRGFTVPALQGLRDYVASGAALSNAGMQAYLDVHPSAGDVATTLQWSKDVNERIGRMVHGIPPFPHVRQSLEMIARQADIVIVSATQGLALEREWGEHDILRYASLVCGQEQGSKAQIIAALAPMYQPQHVMMIGDAPGDRDAARQNAALFYPIRPDEEAQSWQEFAQSGKRFFDGEYAGGHEKELIDAFDQLLPEKPAWKTA